LKRHEVIFLLEIVIGIKYLFGPKVE
jgi:hypothetical protein